MSNKKDNNMPEEEVVIVEMTDEEGNVYQYEEELVIPLGEDLFALLVELPSEDGEYHHEHDCDCGCEDEGNVMIAKIVTNEDGEEEYTDPTDEEFDAVMKAYNEMFDENDYAQE